MDHASLNNKGFTLIEFLVAIVILMVGMLGLLQSVNVALSSNMQNQLRDEAVLVGDELMAEELSKEFDSVSTSPEKDFKTRKISIVQINFSSSKSGTAFQNSKEISYEVSWRHKGIRYTHNVGGLVSKAQQ